MASWFRASVLRRHSGAISTPASATAFLCTTPLRVCQNAVYSTSTSSPQRRYPPTDLVVGDQVHGFEVKRVTPLKDLSHSTAYELEHETGAKYLHIDSNDTENSFAVAFPTFPQDSTGVAHILEHTALCGSEKYDVRDPFFSMYKRTMATFMNAFTAYDWTMYPFTTQHQSDFQNLLSVYLDSAFFPRLKQLAFQQEGHHLEFNNPSDPESGIRINGVVYNEMDGYLSSKDALINYYVGKSLFPTTTYGHQSGGDPEAIPDLTWEQLRTFHRRHYHPTNSYFFSYGDMPLLDHLKFVHVNALSRFQREPEYALSVPDEVRFQEPKRYEYTVPPSSDRDQQLTVIVSTLCNNILDSYETLSMNLLTYLLTNGPSSPMHEAVVATGLGVEHSITGYVTDRRESSLAFGYAEVSSDNADKVETVIHETLQQVCREGFPSDRIEDTLHLVELSLRRPTTNFGPSLFMRTAAWLHGADPTDPFQISNSLERLRTDLNNVDFVSSLIEKNFLQNPHKVILTVKPDPEYSARLAAKRASELATLEEQVLSSPEKVKEVIETAKSLDEYQQEVQDLSVLPSFRVSDVPREVVTVYPISWKQCDSVVAPKQDTALRTGLAQSIQSTNGLVKNTIALDSSLIPEDLLPYVPLYIDIVSHIGTGSRSFKELANDINRFSGGLSVSVSRVANSTNMDLFTEELVVSCEGLARNTKAMTDLVVDVFADSLLLKRDAIDDDTVQYVGTLLENYYVTMMDNISSSATNIAIASASQSLSSVAYRGYQVGGIAHYSMLHELAEQGLKSHSTVHKVLDKIGSIHSCILNAGRPRGLVTADSSGIDLARDVLSDGISQICPSTAAATTDRQVLGGSFEPHAVLPSYVQAATRVHSCARSIRAVPYGDPNSPALLVLSQLLQQGFLHRVIREKGGAYGSGARLANGIFTFYSHNDSNNHATLRAFQDSVSWTREGQFTDADIDEAKLTVFKQLDAPIASIDRGVQEFLTGLTVEERQSFRDGVFASAKQDLLDRADQFLHPRDDTLTGESVVGPIDTKDGFLEASSSPWAVESV
eukprot:TRINITY_DN7048_c0_g1_i2.p1 TRINITY_DN7048_c0_g1~~TRINITY_DN7048_c0_g1_i2.p1  ORF type:complete len:1055 (+),score=80.82 TRINITY_DN7048_c0_g1_i2:224-3388(+)